MNRIHIRNLGRADHGRNIQVALSRARRTDADSLVGKAHVQRMPVRLAIDSDRANAHFLAGVDDTQRNFAAIGDEYFTKHSLWLPCLQSEKGLAILHRLPVLHKALDHFSGRV